jgi:hypothetical protein
VHAGQALDGSDTAPFGQRGDDLGLLFERKNVHG